MKKYIPIYLYGAITIVEGVFLLNSENCDFSNIRYMLGITLTVGAVIAFIAAFSRPFKQVQLAYHQMHALAMLIYGLSVLLICTTSDRLIYATAFILFFYGFSEIIFCSWLFNLGQKILLKILIIRIALGLAIGVGAVVALNFPNFTIEIFGALFILIGINIMLYVPIMKENQISEIAKVAV